MYTCTPTRIHTYIRKHIHTHMQTYTHIHIHAYRDRPKHIKSCTLFRHAQPPDGNKLVMMMMTSLHSKFLNPSAARRYQICDDDVMIMVMKSPPSEVEFRQPLDGIKFVMMMMMKGLPSIF